MADDNRKWFRVSLRFVGDELPVDEISEWLGVDADVISRKGQRIRGNPRYGLYPTNVWGWQPLGSQSEGFEAQILPILDLLEAKPQALAKIKSFSGVKTELFLGFASSNGQGGGFISSNTLFRIGALGINLELDLYPPEERESKK